MGRGKGRSRPIPDVSDGKFKIAGNLEHETLLE